MSTQSLDLLRGTLDVLLLKALAREPLHGYGISRWLRDKTDAVFQVEEGALYPALRRLESKGFVEAEWGITDTGREAKFYTITGPGRGELKRGVATWHRYAHAMSLVLGPA